MTETPTVELERIVDTVAKFTAVISRRLPDDVTARITTLASEERQPMALMIYDTMRKNQELAEELKRPSCQDTGLIQMFVRVGSAFPHIDGLSAALKEAVERATNEAPLRHNSVETFDEYNTGTNTGTDSPWLYWQVVEGSDSLELDVYLAGGGCTLPGQGRTLMPGEGYEGAVKFVLDVMTSYGLNACPPLLVGVGIGSSIDAAGFMSKLALMRPVHSKSANPIAAQLEVDLEDAINSIGNPLIVVLLILAMNVGAIAFAVFGNMLPAGLQLTAQWPKIFTVRTGSLLTGQPGALARALQKISGDMGRIPTQDLRAKESLNAFFITPAFGGKQSLASMFSTHPPLEKRLEQLARISAQLGQ